MPEQALGAELLPPALAVRALIEERLDEAELDGFIAAYFLQRYEGEDQHSRLATKLAELRDGYAFTRGNVAMLEMGEPVRIGELAQNLLRLSGAPAGNAGNGGAKPPARPASETRDGAAASVGRRARGRHP